MPATSEQPVFDPLDVAADLRGLPPLVHRCLRCDAPLYKRANSIHCAACGAEWPVRHGVPFFSSADYFGEVGRTEMQALVDLASRTTWREAIEATFKDLNPEQYGYVADLNRASWIPILPIGPASTVLDVGSGLGALTHALALNYERVVSMEPVDERVQFTRIRLAQEGLTNVDLLQTTIEAMPFYDGTFDLIVLNGILEWVAAWRHDGTPRNVQLDVLRRMRRLLKPDGVLLVGIENRIGFHSFLGRVDHSGLSFTSTMPRWLASFYMKLRQPGFHRTLLNSSLGYRTYTYSPRGYGKLLREAGFEWVDHWWPRDGYNLPHVMHRLADRAEVRDAAIGESNAANRLHGYSLRRELKKHLLDRTALLRATVPDVVILGRPSATSPQYGSGGSSLVDAVNTVLARSSVQGDAASDRCWPSVVMGHRLRNKTVIKFSNRSGPVGVCKVANVRLPRAEAIEHAYGLLGRLHGLFENAGLPLNGSVPAPLRLFRHGSLVASVETPAAGVSFGRMSMEGGYLARSARVVRHLELVAEWLAAAHPALARLGAADGLRGIPLAWRTLTGDSHGVRAAVSHPAAWVQHGDFFPANVLLDEASGRICVIDWDGCDAGYPPLFDWFCFVTGLYYTHRRVRRLPKGATIDRVSFRETFFEQSAFAEAVVRITLQLAGKLGVDRGSLLDLFADYIAVRHHQFEDDRDSGSKARWGSLFREFHAFFLANQERCIFNPRAV